MQIRKTFSRQSTLRGCFITCDISNARFFEQLLACNDIIRRADHKSLFFPSPLLSLFPSLPLSILFLISSNRERISSFESRAALTMGETALATVREPTRNKYLHLTLLISSVLSHFLSTVWKLNSVEIKIERWIVLKVLDVRVREEKRSGMMSLSLHFP